jgi:precorrin-3B C17-methyltransferase
MDNKGMLFLVGIGPGSLEEMTVRAKNILQAADTVIGYTTYIRLIYPLLAGKEVIESSMTREKERCLRAIDEALQGKKVALVSSGDSGIYGMSGLLLELMDKDNRAREIPVEMVPGVPAFVAAAAAVGAPLMNDFAAISLSDLLTPWDVIEKRLVAAASGDFVTCLYNPKSSRRTFQIEKASEIFYRHRDRTTPCAIVRSVSRPEQSIIMTSLEHLKDCFIDMLCMVIIGNSQTALHGKWMITSRGYEL